jgi:hypothetical protein
MQSGAFSEHRAGRGSHSDRLLHRPYSPFKSFQSRNGRNVHGDRNGVTQRATDDSILAIGKRYNLTMDACSRYRMQLTRTFLLASNSLEVLSTIDSSQFPRQSPCSPPPKHLIDYPNLSHAFALPLPRSRLVLHVQTILTTPRLR